MDDYRKIQPQEPPDPRRARCLKVLSFLKKEKITLSSFLIELFRPIAPSQNPDNESDGASSSGELDDEPEPLIAAALCDISLNLSHILKFMCTRSRLCEISVAQSAIPLMVSEASELCTQANRHPFAATKLTTSDIKSLNLFELQVEIQTSAPCLWSLLDAVMGKDSRTDKRKRRRRAAAEAKREQKPADLLESDVEGSISEDQLPQVELRVMRIVICMAIIAQTRNQRCNTLQSLIGCFLRSCNTPSTVVDLLSRIGLSVSASTISLSIDSIAAEIRQDIVKLGKTCRVGLTMDNLDGELASATPTLENSMERQFHLTSGFVWPLQGGITTTDLDCAAYLWERSKLNPLRNPRLIPVVDFPQLIQIHPEPDFGPSGLNRRQRFNAWVFLRDLLSDGPEILRRRFQHQLGKPESIDQIPFIPGEPQPYVPLRTLKVKPDSPGTNATAIDEFFKQMAVGDPSEEGQKDFQTFGNLVCLISGDLLTGERLRSLQVSRSEEKSIGTNQWAKMQWIIYVLGLFHLKMACADAIWRLLIYRKQSRLDDNALIKLIAKLRERETRKFESKPTFRQMHEAIQHVGIVTRLDCWRIEVLKLGFSSLEAYAESNPTWVDLCAIADILSKDYVAIGQSISNMRDSDADDERDKQHENALIQQQLFLLYEELSFSLNHGDIGRAETTFPSWAFIFTECGKHKYAAELIRYLRYVHFIYPPGLRKAIRYNILINPTGKEGCFRALDWVNEFINLYIKRIYCGKGSNRSVEHMINESPLVEVYRGTRKQLEEMFQLHHNSNRHSKPKLENTFKQLAEYLKQHQTNEIVPGRETHYEIRDAAATGILTVLKNFKTVDVLDAAVPTYSTVNSEYMDVDVDVLLVEDGEEDVVGEDVGMDVDGGNYQTEEETGEEEEDPELDDDEPEVDEDDLEV